MRRPAPHADPTLEQLRSGSDDEAPDEEPLEAVAASPARWVQLGVFAVASFMCAMDWNILVRAPRRAAHCARMQLSSPVTLREAAPQLSAARRTVAGVHHRRGAL
jgi:hypothetical protein